MITGTNELKTLTKHISCECKYKFDIITVGVNVKIKKNIVYMKKIIFGILMHFVAKIVNM